MYRKIIVEYPNAEPSLALAISVKALNDASAPEEIIFLRSSVWKIYKTLQKVWTKAGAIECWSKSCKCHYCTKEHKQHYRSYPFEQSSSTRCAKSFAKKIYKAVDQVPVWREGIFKWRTGDWLEPFQMEGIDETAKPVYICDDTNYLTGPSNLEHVTPYHAHDNLAPVVVDQVIE